MRKTISNLMLLKKLGVKSFQWFGFFKAGILAMEKYFLRIRECLSETKRQHPREYQTPKLFPFTSEMKQGYINIIQH